MYSEKEEIYIMDEPYRVSRPHVCHLKYFFSTFVKINTNIICPILCDFT